MAIDPLHSSQTDDDLDPLELQDREDTEPAADEADETAVAEDPAAEPASAEAKEEEALTKEIDAVTKDEEVVVKKGGHMIPRHLIDRELTPEDLWDEGSL